MVGPAAKREAVAYLRDVLQMSERRACTLVAADRKMIRYRSRRPPDVELRTRLRDLANQRRRFGYRRLIILLREQGEPSGINRIYRLYREEGLTVRKRKAQRRAVGTRTPILVEAKVNARWSLDFVHDQFAAGRRFRILNIVDDVTRECLAAIPDSSISGKRVVRVLTHLIVTRGKPGMIVSDNGTEFTSNPSWAGQRTIRWNGTTSHPANQCRMAISNLSTVACAMSFSTRACSSVSTRLARSSASGPPITTTRGHIPRSATRPRQPFAGTLAALKGASPAEALTAAG
jgi:putative transposase